jgi:hypothetical protein
MDRASSRLPDATAALALLATVLVLYLLSPREGAFWWSDAPRHALNGVFVKDLVLDMPWRDPSGYAFRYYAQYPALTILFYPPLFYVVSAPFFAVFGDSHEVALLVVMLHYAAYGWGSYRLASLWLRAPAALGYALTAVLLPEVALWGRQIMLEVPAFAYLVWSVVWFVRHLRSGATGHLAAAVALLVAAMYTKISVAFMIPVFGLALTAKDGWRVLITRRMLTIAVSGAVSLLPLVALTLHFGQANVQSVAGIVDSPASRKTLAGWTWYAEQLPLQLGWPLLVALLLCVALSVRGRRRPAACVTIHRSEWWLLGSWLVVSYMFFSFIELKEARHSVFVLCPLVLMPILLFARAGGTGRQLGAIGLICTVCAGGWTLVMRPVPFVDGYRQAAQWVHTHSKPGTSVMFFGYRDGAFIFNLRSLDSSRQLHAVRADKLLVRVAVRRELGVEEKTLDVEQLSAWLNKQAVHYVVLQPSFWNDIDVMRRFEEFVTTSAQFEKVAEFETPANSPVQESKLEIWRNKTAAAARSESLEIELPMVRKTIKAGS